MNAQWFYTLWTQYGAQFPALTYEILRPVVGL